MSNIVHAWKDAAYRESLSVEEQAMLPANPVGEIELADAELEAIFGADGGKKHDEANSGASSSATLSQNGGLNVGIPDINAFVPVLAIPVGTQQNPAQCISSAGSAARVN